MVWYNMFMIRVGVIRGGVSNEHDVSLATGMSVLQNLSRERFKVIDIVIDKNGQWKMYGFPIDRQEIIPHVDVCFNALHGGDGEDGKLSQWFEEKNIPYTGSGPFAGAVGMHKKFAKDHVRNIGIKTPAEVVIKDWREMGDIDVEEYLKESVQKVFNTFSPPWVAKPLSGGSSHGVFVVRTTDELFRALKTLSDEPGDIMVEEYVSGKEATVATLENFRDELVYAFLPIEIRVPSGRFFDYEMKYGGRASEETPGSFSAEEKRLLQEYARAIHKAIGIRHYARHDFIVSPRGIYFLETNTLPGLTSESLLPKSLHAVGASFPEFLEHVIALAINRK